jgi:hypothetical protein
MLGRANRNGAWCARGPLSEADLARGGGQLSSEVDLARGGAHPSSEADLARGGAQPGRGGHRGRDCVMRVFRLRGLVCVLHFLRN